ncbi:thermonuclease family protein [Chryseobacterium balustinum]|uniref:Endonuclease YncB, thermonuclease family n=1 Tax=Chryseobacterium balustinum TaxID=246 RepID=A0ABY1LBZ9_9FLAO|nr:thermonuclease family protein [Chryseobacterium balustinum]AZB32100.1 nuclease [Chryseobacterium balustinum]SKB94263.1 Endonuclease YncB, thermonuclease family [Chryseobacterium balustinum]
MKKIVLIILFFSCISLIAQTKARVVGIKDGDTIVVLLAGNIIKTIRLAEVDCPEKGQPFGKNAKQFTADLVFNKEIFFVETDIDRYGRTIAKVYIKGKYLSREIIKAGLGWWYFQYSNDNSLGEAQKSACDQKRGLWQDSKAIAPWVFRANIKRPHNKSYHKTKA